MDCPLCDSKMKLKLVGGGDILTKTYIWVCDDCPGILFEYHDDFDLENLERYIKMSREKLEV